MGPLTNQRHERFAQAWAEGKTATEAYVLAGYKANDGNASRMKGNERISALRSGPKSASSVPCGNWRRSPFPTSPRP